MSEALTKIRQRLVCLFIAVLMVGCQASSPRRVEEPQVCPGVPPAKEFGLSVNDLFNSILNSPDFDAAISAMFHAEWAEAEKHYKSVLQSAKASSVERNYKNYIATGLFHALCMQGKHQEAANTAREYGITEQISRITRKLEKSRREVDAKSLMAKDVGAAEERHKKSMAETLQKRTRDYGECINTPVNYSLDKRKAYCAEVYHEDAVEEWEKQPAIQ